MTQEEIIKGNKLIAEFIGAKIIPNQGDAKVEHFVFDDRITLCIWDLKYNTSWDWLIPVAKKCIASYHDNRQDIFEALHKCDIEKLYKAIVEFIEWYNAEGV